MQLPYEPVCPWVGWLVAWSVCNNGGKLHFLASIESLVFNVTRWKIVGRLRLRTHIYSFCISNLRSVGQTDRRNDGMTDRQTDGRPAKWTPIFVVFDALYIGKQRLNLSNWLCWSSVWFLYALAVTYTQMQNPPTNRCNWLHFIHLTQ